MKKVFSLALAFCFVFLFIADACAAKPSIKKQPESATTTEDRTVSFSVTAGGDVSSYSWFFVNPATGKKVSGKKLEKNKALQGIKVTGTNRPTITLVNVPDVMNGWLVYCVVGGNGYKIDSEYATLLVYGMDPPETAPVTTGLEITAQPRDAGISSKGTLTFTVKYTGLAEKITWGFINPKDGQKVIGKNILKKFKGMKANSFNKAKLTLSDVPEGMVGWKVYAHFKIKGSEFDSDTATVLSAEEAAAQKAAAKAAKEEAKKAEEAKTVTVSCSHSMLRKLDSDGNPVGEPSDRLTFTEPGSFIISSDQPIKSWTMNGVGNVPSSPVREFRVTNVQEDLFISLTFE